MSNIALASMTAEMMERAFCLRDPRLTSDQKSVLIHYAYLTFYENGHAAWIPIELLAAILSMDVGIASACIKTLVGYGYLRVSEDQWYGERNHATVYDVMIGDFPEPAIDFTEATQEGR